VGNRSWNFGEKDWSEQVKAILDALPHGLEISAPEVLFAKIEDADIEAWKLQFGGDA